MIHFHSFKKLVWAHILKNKTEILILNKQRFNALVHVPILTDLDVTLWADLLITDNALYDR